MPTAEVQQFYKARPSLTHFLTTTVSLQRIPLPAALNYHIHLTRDGIIPGCTFRPFTQSFANLFSFRSPKLILLVSTRCTRTPIDLSRIAALSPHSHTVLVTTNCIGAPLIARPFPHTHYCTCSLNSMHFGMTRLHVRLQLLQAPRIGQHDPSEAPDLLSRILQCTR